MIWCCDRVELSDRIDIVTQNETSDRFDTTRQSGASGRINTLRQAAKRLIKQLITYFMIEKGLSIWD